MPPLVRIMPLLLALHVQAQSGIFELALLLHPGGAVDMHQVYRGTGSGAFAHLGRSHSQTTRIDHLESVHDPVIECEQLGDGIYELRLLPWLGRAPRWAHGVSAEVDVLLRAAWSGDQFHCSVQLPGERVDGNGTPTAVGMQWQLDCSQIRQWPLPADQLPAVRFHWPGGPNMPPPRRASPAWPAFRPATEEPPGLLQAHVSRVSIQTIRYATERGPSGYRIDSTLLGLSLRLVWESDLWTPISLEHIKLSDTAGEFQRYRPLHSETPDWQQLLPGMWVADIQIEQVARNRPVSPVPARTWHLRGALRLKSPDREVPVLTPFNLSAEALALP